jgi:alkaline phosphatase D
MKWLSLLLLVPTLTHAGTVEIGPWCGAVTPTSAVVKAKITGTVALEMDKRPPVTPTISSNGIATYVLTGLKPEQTYAYRLGTASGRFRTFPIDEASFWFVFGSCGGGNNHPVYAAMAETQPLFYLNLGDLHYSDIATNNPALFRKAYETVFAGKTYSQLFRRTPFIYMWDDHDYGPNDSDKNSPSREASRQVYREYIPHYPLPDPGAIYQTFEVGRVKFILTDLRSERTPANHEDNAEKSMLGAKQKECFKRELLAAKGRYPLVFWVSSVTWIAKPGKGDNWGGYATERRELANFMKANGIKNVCILTGDAHMTSADNGTNGDYADGGGAPLRQLMSSPLDRPGNSKGGPYSHGVYVPGKGEGLYGLVTVDDQGEEISVTFSGRNHEDEEKVTYQFTVPEK